MQDSRMLKEGQHVRHIKNKQGIVQQFHIVKKKFYVLWDSGKITLCKPENLIPITSPKHHTPSKPYYRSSGKKYRRKSRKSLDTDSAGRPAATPTKPTAGKANASADGPMTPDLSRTKGASTHEPTHKSSVGSKLKSRGLGRILENTDVVESPAPTSSSLTVSETISEVIPFGPATPSQVSKVVDHSDLHRLEDPSESDQNSPAAPLQVARVVDRSDLERGSLHSDFDSVIDDIPATVAGTTAAKADIPKKSATRPRRSKNYFKNSRKNNARKKHHVQNFESMYNLSDTSESDSDFD